MTEPELSYTLYKLGVTLELRDGNKFGIAANGHLVTKELREEMRRHRNTLLWYIFHCPSFKQRMNQWEEMLSKWLTLEDDTHENYSEVEDLVRKLESDALDIEDVLLLSQLFEKLP